MEKMKYLSFPIPIFSPPLDFVPVKLARRPFLAKAGSAGPR